MLKRKQHIKSRSNCSERSLIGLYCIDGLTKAKCLGDKNDVVFGDT